MTGNGAVGANYGDLLVTSLIVLGAVCIAAFVAVRFFGRFFATGRARGTHMLDVVARLPLEPRRSLYVVEVAGKTLLVGTSEMGLSVLSELDAAEVRARVEPRQSFAELVRGAWQKRRGLAASASRDVSAETRGRHTDVAHSREVSAEAHGRVSDVQGSRDVSAETRGRPSDVANSRDVSAEAHGRGSDVQGSRDVSAETRGRVSDVVGSRDVSAETRGRILDASEPASEGESSRTDAGPTP